MILIKKIDSNHFSIKISNNTITTHNIILDDDDYFKYSLKNISREKLVEASFKFLLDREPNTSILENFNLKIINNYFPEYNKKIGRYFD
tara:strand:+ start:2880 stop:3146 length:267 start_codon:yes stop_codon:yes gene_type:complete